MTTPRTVAYIAGATVLVAWFAAADGIPRGQRAASGPRPPAPDVAFERIASDVQAQAERLRARLAVAPVPQTPQRNPFRFDVRAAPAPRPAPPEPAAAAAPILEAVTAEPSLSLLGVAERHTDAGVVGTAIIGGAADALFMVQAGEEVAGRYRVVAVGRDTVELKDLLTGATRRLALKSPAERP